MWPSKAATFFGAMAFAMLVSCRDAGSNSTGPADATNPYQSYRVNYNATTRQLAYFAQFFAGSSAGSSLELASPVGITIDGVALTHVHTDASGHYYQATTDGDFVADHEIVFIAADGHKYVNKISLVAVEPEDVPASVSRKDTVTMGWTPEDVLGTTVGEVLFSLEDVPRTATVQDIVLGIGKKTATMPLLNTVAVGDGIVFLEASNEPPLQDKAGAGGKMSWRYYSTAHALKITE